MTAEIDNHQVTSPATRARARRDPSARWAWALALWDSLSAFLSRAREHRRTVRGATPGELAAPDVDRSDLWHQSPASLADLFAFTTSGAWAPGKRHWSIELLGKAYGFTALAASAGLYATAWVVQRPGRLFAAAVLYFVLRWTSGWSA